MSSDKMPTSHQENIDNISTSTPINDPEKFCADVAVGANLELDEDALPPGYFRSKFFVGSMAVCLSLKMTYTSLTCTGYWIGIDGGSRCLRLRGAHFGRYQRRYRTRESNLADLNGAQ